MIPSQSMSAEWSASGARSIRSAQLWFILILESVFLLFKQQNNPLSAFHLVCAFMSLISKVYFMKFYVHFILCACFQCLHKN